jgi:endonuclease YncB( thermonuclease family)
MPTTSYDKILQEISEIYESSQQEGSKNWNKSLLHSHWKIGERIVIVEQNQDLRAEYGAKVLSRLAEDLQRKLGKGFSTRNLRYMRQFYSQYKKKHFNPGVSWSHYRELVSISDEKERIRLENLVVSQNLSVRDLQILRKELMKEDRNIAEESGDTKKKKNSKNFQLRKPVLVLYTYRVGYRFSMNLAHSVPNLDLGFRIKYKLGDTGEFKGKDILSVSKNNSSFAFEKISAKKELYTYKAYLERVIDGDTLLVTIDLGFSIFKEQRLRLRGIDAPELGEPGGSASKRFVESELKNAQFLIIKTYGTDLYDRYLVDIFYLPGEEDSNRVIHEGKFLNNELLNEGFATPFR